MKKSIPGGRPNCVTSCWVSKKPVSMVTAIAGKKNGPLVERPATRREGDWDTIVPVKLPARQGPDVSKNRPLWLCDDGAPTRGWSLLAQGVRPAGKGSSGRPIICGIEVGRRLPVRVARPGINECVIGHVPGHFRPRVCDDSLETLPACMGHDTLNPCNLRPFIPISLVSRDAVDRVTLRREAR